MAKKKEFFSSFDKNLSIAEEVATVNKQAPPIVKTTTIAKAVAVEAKATSAATPVPAAAVASKPAPKAAAQPKAQTQLIKKKTKEAAPTPEIVKNTNPARPTTFRIDVDLMETIKAVAYWERKKIQDVLDDALRTYMNEIPKQELTKARKAYSTAN